MPKTTRAYVKASVVYLCLGSLLGVLLLVNRWTPIWPGLGALRTSHVVFLLVGWLTQLILGVGWWLFPPLPFGLNAEATTWSRHGQTQRGSEPLFWATFACLNVGIWLQAVFSPLNVWLPARAFEVAGRAAAFLLLAAAASFVVNMWARVRELGKARYG
jgi:hypothetical protein